MQRFVRQFAIVFLLWTLIAIAGTAADYLLLQALGKPTAWWHLLRRPLTEQWIWAALTPVVFVIARRFPLSRPGIARAAAIHACCFLMLSLLHCAIADMLGSPFAAAPGNYHGSMLNLRFLEEFYSDIWMYWPLVCIQALLDTHARARERERHATQLESLLASSQLALLRAQIQPHFLFNTLHAVSALVRVDADAAQDMLADLAEILRTSFTEATGQETSLRQELVLVCCYLRIQGRRFGDRLQVHYQVDPESLDAAVPALVLQSLVENAVVHGIAPLSRPGTISVRSFRRAERLMLQVDDDGVGLGRRNRAGVGLTNARRRLECLYGAAGQSLELRSLPGAGTSATVSFPFHIHAAPKPEESQVNEDTDTDRGRRAACAATSDIATEP
jgi:signal transduction histidine kinase